MKIFLTGGTGFIGSHFINLALSQGHSVVALKRSDSSEPKIKLINSPTWINRNYNELVKQDFQNIDVLVHLAAHSANVPYDTLENCIIHNVIEPLKMFKLAQSSSVMKYVIAGSCFEYGISGEKFDYISTTAPLEPTQSYPTSKALSSITFGQFAREHSVELSYHRIFQVFGEGEPETRLWPSLKKAAILGKDFPMTKGEQLRDFINVTEVASKLLKACSTSQTPGKPSFKNLGSGKSQSIKEFSKFWWDKWNATGSLKIGELPYRKGEVMRYLPSL